MGRWMIYSERDPLLSSIVLFPDKNQDGFLRAEEIFSRDFRASLCFLPSHGEGMERGWQGPISFVLGLLYAGVPTVVTPIWPVDREVRDSFYYDFYSSLKDHSVSYALEEAQFSLRQKYPGLRSWGSFQLVGFEGMNPGEKIRHAEKHLITEVRKGLIYEQRKEYRDAVELFERALDLAEAVQDTTFKERLMLLIIRASRDGSMWSKAIEYQNLIKEAAERKGNRENLLWSMKNLVTFYIRDGQQKQAVQEKKEYIDFILGEGRLEEVASSYQELGFIYAMGREFANAVDQIDEAYTLYEELEDSEGQGSSLIIKGRFELEGDLYWEAIRDLKLGIKRLEEIVADSSNISKIQMGLASGNQLLGLACEKVARYDEALIYQGKGLDLFEKLQLDAQVAQGIQYLANLYWKTGDYRQATFYQEKALKEFESMDDKKLLAMAYNTQGLIYLSLGNVSDARSAEHKALDLAEASGSLADQATILKNMGMICVRENDLNQAYEYFLQASSIDSSIGFRRGLAYDYRNLGTLIVRLGRSEEGISLLDNGLRLSREIGDRRNEVHAYYGLGQAYRINGDMKSALAVLDSGAVSAAGLNIPELLWRIYRLRAGVLKDTGRDSEALIDYKKAIEVVEGLRAELKVEAFKQGFLDDKMDLYVDVISHLLEMGKNEEALGFVERAKSRSFIDLLGNKRLVLSEAKGDLLEQERAARMDLQEAQDRIAAYAGATREVLTSRERDEKREWQIELEKRRKHFETVLVKIRIENPELASFVSVDPWKVDEIQNILPDSTALVEYFLTRKELFVWVVASDNIIARRIDVQADNIRELVREFRETIQANLSVDLESRELYQLLIKPIESDIQSIRHLVLVPHGVLHYLPFAALQDEEGIYLLERFSLSLAPSATVLGYCLEKGGEGFGEAAKKSVLAFSNPDLKNPLYDLPFAEKEVVSLRRTFNRVKAFFGENALEGRVIEEAGSHNLIHFASHATYEPESPLFSSILLSPSESNDGRLEAHEIFGLKLNCDLVTLSACETGLGKITEGDEIIGLARSFIFAGTPSIITSLWKVDDLSTAVMVKRFYRFLRAGFSRSEALRQAQLLVREGINGHPSAWAAFTLTGDFR
jgi:CHAT domain-containing protein